MKEFLQKTLSYAKKIGLTTLLVVLAWFAYARGFNDDVFDPQVKVVKFYPNPATSYINFEFPEDIDKTFILEIYSFVGRKIATVPVSSNKITLTLSNDFYRGIYIFHLCDKSGKVLDFGKFQVVK